MSEQDYSTVLWDIDRSKVDILPADFVIQRVLSYGAIRLIMESIKKNGFATVKEVFLKMKPSSISAKKYAYLKNYLLA